MSEREKTVECMVCTESFANLGFLVGILDAEVERENWDEAKKTIDEIENQKRILEDCLDIETLEELETKIHELKVGVKNKDKTALKSTLFDLMTHLRPRISYDICTRVCSTK